MTVGFIPRSARWNAMELPVAPAPTTTTSGTSAAPPSTAVPEHLVGRVVPGRARDPTPGVGPRPTEVQGPDRRSIAGPPGHRSVEEQLVRRQVAVEDVPLGQPVDALKVERREHLHGL